MSSITFSEWVNKRYIAHLNLIQLLELQGIEPIGEGWEWFYPKTLDEFRIAWQDTTLDESSFLDPHLKGELKRDNNPVLFVFNDIGEKLLIIYVHPPVGKNSVTKTKIVQDVENRMLEQTGETEVSVNTNLQTIVITDEPLSGEPKKIMRELNKKFKLGVLTFSLSELQFNPTKHKMAPKRLIKASPNEIKIYVENQIGLLSGRHVIADRYDERRAALDTEEEKIEFDRKIYSEILSLMPSYNSNDPLVKWYNFKPGDIIKVYRNFGQTKFTYRRVLLSLEDLV